MANQIRSGGRSIRSDDGQSIYSLYEIGDVEYVNPTELMDKVLTDFLYRTKRDAVLLKFGALPKFALGPTHDAIKRLVKQDLKVLKESQKNVKIPKALIELLNTVSKKDQVKLLSGLKITSDQLQAFAYYAHGSHGYKFSQYKTEHLPQGVDGAALPTVAEVVGDTVDVVGKTSLTHGQIAQAIDHRHVVVSKFFDKGDIWHCFFLTYKGLAGNEKGNEGQPHYHYISNRFGLPRDEVVARLKASRYNLGSLPHIDLIRSKKT
jgi:hypothetical protein